MGWQFTTVTDIYELRLIANQRGIEDPENCHVKCGRCQMELDKVRWLVAHFEGCFGEYEDIIFEKQNSKTGKWIEVGTPRTTVERGPLAF